MVSLKTLLMAAEELALPRRGQRLSRSDSWWPGLGVHRGSSAQIWAELQQRAFPRLGGTVRVLVVLDDLREGVLQPDINYPTLNPLCRGVLAHYGVVALPCLMGNPYQRRSRSRRLPRPKHCP